MGPWGVRLTWLECNGARVRYFCAFSTLTQTVTELTEILEKCKKSQTRAWVGKTEEDENGFH